MNPNSKRSIISTILIGKGTKKIHGLLFLSVLIISTFLIIISAFLYNNPYLMLRESVSSLGIQSENPRGFIYFRIAFIFSGLFFISHFLYIYRALHPTAYHTSRAALVISIISCIGVIGTGIFPEDNPIPHYTNAIVAFIGFSTTYSCYLYILIKKVKIRDSWPKIWHIVLLYFGFYFALIGFLVVFSLFWLYYFYHIVIFYFYLPLWEWILVFGIVYWIIGIFIIIPKSQTANSP